MTTRNKYVSKYYQYHFPGQSLPFGNWNVDQKHYAGGMFYGFYDIKAVGNQNVSNGETCHFGNWEHC